MITSRHPTATRRSKLKWLSALALSSVMALAPSVMARTTLNVQSFLPSGFGQDFLSVNSARIGTPMTVTAGVNIHYTDSLLRVTGEDQAGRSVTQTVVGTRLMGEVLLSFAPIEQLDIALAMPLVFMGDSDATGVLGLPDTSGFHVGELRFSLKGQFFANEDVAVGLVLDTTLPTSDDASFVGNGVGFFPKLVVDFKADIFRGAVNAGAYLRLEDAEITPNGALGGTPFFTASHELYFSLAGALDVYDGLSILGEVYARTALTNPFGDDNANMMEAMGGIRYQPISEFAVTAGGGGGTPLFTGYGTAKWRAFLELRYFMQAAQDSDGDGVDDGDDQCEMLAEDIDGFQDDDGCPDPDNDGDDFLDTDDKCPDEAEDVDGFQDDDGCRDDDNDGDGIADGSDLCPDSAEDKDGFLDEDGCPELDNDEDGLADAADRCPLVAENLNGYEDTDGCPDFPGVSVANDKIVVKMPLGFTGRGELKGGSYEDLRNVARLILAHPEWKVVRIDSHTDDRGREDKLVKRAQTRGDAVLRLLVVEGVDERRLKVRAVGGAEPIADNKKRAGRTANNRVEFVILKHGVEVPNLID